MIVAIAQYVATKHPAFCPTCFADGRKLGVSLALQPLCTRVARDGICIFATPSAISELLTLGCRSLDYVLMRLHLELSPGNISWPALPRIMCTQTSLIVT